MKKTKSAVKYGMEVLKLSPDELFKLIESSQGYQGEDYARWLAGKIIEVAEEDGVLFSQLLVKKFNIINEILEEVSEEQEIRSEFLEIMSSTLHKKLYSVDLNVVGEPLDVDWYTGLDMDTENSFFTREKLPEDIQSLISGDEEFSMLFRLSLEPADKKSDLYVDAKSQGLVLGSKGAMILYRLCSMVGIFELGRMSVGVLAPVKFLYDRENSGIIEYLLSFFNVSEGYCIKSIDMSRNALNSGDVAFMVFTPRTVDSSDQDGIVLTSIALDDNETNGFVELESKRYSKSYQPMLNKIADESPALVDSVMTYSLGKQSGNLGKGLYDAYGYLNVNGSITLSTLPEEGKQSIAITRENVKDVIAYYGVTSSRELDWGYSSDISCLIDGGYEYEELLYNCIPLFLFDSRVDFMDMGEYVNASGEVVKASNKLGINSSDLVQDLLDVGMPYFSFEAKELFNVCKDYISYTEKNLGIEGKSFKELRELSDNSDFNDMYESKLLGLKEYINGLSKKFM